MRPLRIAMLSHAYPYLEGTHAAQFVHELASTVVELGHLVYAVIPTPSRDGPRVLDGVHLEYYQAGDLVSYGRASNEYVKAPKLSVALSLARAVIKLRRVVRAREIDVIHAHWAVPMGFVGSIVKLTTQTPLVITSHGRDVYVDPEAGAVVPNLWYVRPFLRFALGRADRAIAVSQDCRRHAVAAGAPSDRVTVIHNGVNARQFAPRLVRPIEVGQLLGVKESARLILFVGSLMGYKGVDVLIRAMPLVLETEPLAVAVIIGSGPEREDLMALRDHLRMQEAVIFAGQVSNPALPQYYNACDIFVLPSHRESFGIAAVEAMACAKPVVGTRVGGLKEVIDHGETGLLVEPDDARQLAESVVRILGDEALAQRLGVNARRKVEAQYDWRVIARETVSLYEDVLAQQPALRTNTV